MLAFLGQEHKHLPSFQIAETAERYWGYQITARESKRKRRQVATADTMALVKKSSHFHFVLEYKHPEAA